MSVLFLSHAFNARVGNSLRKLILLKLCDNAGDNGECWPSVGHIARQCEASRRAVVGHLQALEVDGFIRTEARFVAGAQRSNVYTVSMAKLKSSALGDPADEGEKGTKNSRKNPKQGVQDMHTEPSLRTIIEPSIEYLGAAPKNQSNDLVVPKPKKSKAVSSLDYSKWPTLPRAQLLEDWLRIRKAKRLTNTQTAFDAVGDELHKSNALGFTVDQCFEVAVKKSWGGFEAQWLINLVQAGGMAWPSGKNAGSGLVAGSGGHSIAVGSGKPRDIPLSEQLSNREWAK